MAIGLAALLDDIAAVAKSAAASVDDVASMTGKVSARAVSLAIDDAAVTPQYLKDASPNRELPMIWRIAKGSLLNKAIILPIIILLSTLFPFILTPMLMLGGLYLSYEGAEKILEHISNKHPKQETPAVDEGSQSEDEIVKSAITTDFILSLEIMVISLSTVADQTLVLKVITLILVALLITALVYGSAALLIRIDDIGLKLLRDTSSPFKQKLGTGMVNSMPTVLNIVSVIGTFAMLWVGGHILISGFTEFGFSIFEHVIQVLVVKTSGISHIPLLGPIISWLLETLCSAVFSCITGIFLVMTGKLIRENFTKQKR